MLTKQINYKPEKDQQTEIKESKETSNKNLRGFDLN
jgi:hypothetical protein